MFLFLIHIFFYFYYLYEMLLKVIQDYNNLSQLKIYVTILNKLYLKLLVVNIIYYHYHVFPNYHLLKENLLDILRYLYYEALFFLLILFFYKLSYLLIQLKVSLPLKCHPLHFGQNFTPKTLLSPNLNITDKSCCLLYYKY